MKTEIKPTHLARSPEGEFLISWTDGSTRKVSQRDLRLRCPCASCVDEFTGEPLLDPATVPQTIRVQRLRSVGHYAVAFEFSDGHKTGIYPWEMLRRIAEISI
jgi:DUF971 family protein